MMSFDLGSVCRQYAFVPVRDKPYDERLTSLIDGLHMNYQAGISTVESQREQLSIFGDKKEEYSSLITETIKRMFPRGRKGADQQKIAELCGELEQEIGNLDSLYRSLQQAYNKQARTIYDLCASLNELEQVREDYALRCQRVSEQICRELGLDADLDDRSRSKNIFEKKILNDSIILLKKEKIFFDLPGLHFSPSPKMRRDTDRSQRIRKMCEEYLTLEHDEKMARSEHAMYKPLVDEYEAVVASISTMSENVTSETVAAKAILMACRLITETELLLGQAPQLGGSFKEKVQSLQRKMDLVDDKFSRQVLAILFGDNFQVTDGLPLNGVGHEVVKHVISRERGDRL